MKPQFRICHWLGASAAAVILALGCQSPLFNFRGQSPDDSDTSTAEVVERASVEGVELIRHVAMPTGMTYIAVDGVGLVTDLNHTGSNPPPSPYREVLKDEMETHDADNPERIMSGDSTALVLVRALLPPGVQKGDRVDVEVRCPRGSKTTSLEDGWLMRARLREHAVLDRQLRTGRDLALAEGHVLMDAVFSGSKEHNEQVRGRVLGGGYAQHSRTLGLQLREEFASPFRTAAVAAAINARFHRGSMKGVATAKNDMYVELLVAPRYKNNIYRYMRVVRSIAIDETTAERGQRLQKLQRMLLEPTSAATAALRLEAIGDDAIPVLKSGLKSPHPEVSFFAAQALAYLDVSDAALPLALAARHERAFRWHALTALATMDHVAAYDALCELLTDTGAETRYGAFRALRVRNPRDPMFSGEVLSEQFVYHRVSSGKPMIHFSSTRGPELVVFGLEHPIKPPAFLFAGSNIMLKGLPDGRLKVIRFLPGLDDREEVVEADVDHVVRAIVRLGGTYADVYQALSGAKQDELLESRLVVNAKAHRNRKYLPDEGRSFLNAPGPVPDLYADRLSEQGPEEEDHSDIDPEPEEEPRKGILGRIIPWKKSRDKN